MPFCSWGGGVLLRWEQRPSKETLRIASEVEAHGGRPTIRFGGIRAIEFTGPEIGDSSLAILEKVKPAATLTYLMITDTRVSDAGLVHLQNVSSLRWICIENTPITDNGLIHLRGLDSLCELSLWGTDVTPDAVRQLRSQLPPEALIDIRAKLPEPSP